MIYLQVSVYLSILAENDKSSYLVLWEKNGLKYILDFATEGANAIMASQVFSINIVDIYY